MGVSLILEIIPEKIEKEEWENVYDETLKLIDEYPLAMLKSEKSYGIDRFVLDRTMELGDEDKYWEICGDLETKERAETFRLYKDLHHYMKWRKDIQVSDDIILLYLNDSIAPRVFSEKTQGKNYHHYILSIGALIESRFEGAAILYGDFDKRQAEISINWVNNIVSTPIELPILVDYKRLYNKLKSLRMGKNLLKEFYRLAYGHKELNDFVGDNFSKPEIYQYYKEEMKEYNSVSQFGVINMMIDILNMGYSLEDLSDICCLSEDGPKFNKDEFIKSLCSTWVFVPRKHIDAMDIYKKDQGQADNVNRQMENMYLEMKGFQGRNIEVYIPIDEFRKSLKCIFEEKDNVEEIINETYMYIIEKLEKQTELIDQVNREHNEMLESNRISEMEQILDLQKILNIDQKIVQSLGSIKKIANHMADNSKELGSDKIFPGIEDKYSQNQLAVKAISNEGIVLSKNAWNWIENIEDYREWMILITAIGMLKESKILLKTLLENKDLFYKYIVK